MRFCKVAYEKPGQKNWLIRTLKIANIEVYGNVRHP